MSATPHVTTASIHIGMARYPMPITEFQSEVTAKPMTGAVDHMAEARKRRIH